VIAVFLPAGASAERAFGPRFTVNTQGDFAIAANSLESCLDASGVCADVRNGVATKPNNNDNTVTWIDVDGFVDGNGDGKDDTLTRAPPT
jgi:hypothetical protein